MKLSKMEKKYKDKYLIWHMVGGMTKNLKLFPNHGGIYRFRKKSKKDSGEINPLGVHRNMRGCILEVSITSSSCLKLTVQVQLALHPCDRSLIK